MAATAALVRSNVGPSTALSGRPRAEVNQRQRQAACSGLRDHKASLLSLDVYGRCDSHWATAIERANLKFLCALAEAALFCLI
jgi:hypothetical protein